MANNTVTQSRPGTRAADHHTARHEAAHAVVAARLGLLLMYTDILEHMQRSGRTRLGRAAAANPTASATVAAAGIVIECDLRTRFWEISPGAPAAGDVMQLAKIAQRLGVLRHWRDLDDDPVFASWARAAVRRAQVLLRRGGGAAWRRVTAALLRDHRVSGAAVYALVQHGR